MFLPQDMEEMRSIEKCPTDLHENQSQHMCQAVRQTGHNVKKGAAWIYELQRCGSRSINPDTDLQTFLQGDGHATNTQMR